MIITTDMVAFEEHLSREDIADLIQDKKLSKKHEVRKRLNIILYNELQNDNMFTSRILLDRFRAAYELHLQLVGELSINFRTLYTRNKTLIQEMTRLHTTQQNHLSERSRLWDQIKEKDEEISKLKTELEKREGTIHHLKEEVLALKLSNSA
mmetsp:Transcript_23895/g.36576  ORF Transcript_23895/g.36576 Transcript_23895/m.36576 type:complete len:152 (-) Transcript_23895:1066-1521(-)